MTETPSEHWSDYWSHGYVTSLPQDFPGNYDGEIRTFWESQFASVPGDAKLLDVCTGNGAVALLAAAWSRLNDAGFEITAVDAAHLDPASLARRHPRAAHLLRSVRFVGDMPLETCTLPDGAWDLVTSQYGIEYCRPDAAADRVARLLRPGGRFAMLAHESGSDIVATMASERAEYSGLEEAGLFEILETCLSARTDPVELQGRLEKLEHRIAASGESPLRANVLGLVRHVRSLDGPARAAQRDRLARALAQLRHALARLDDMLRVNRMIQEDPAWHRVFEAKGLVPVDSGEILHRGRHRSGQFHVYRKPGMAEAA